MSSKVGKRRRLQRRHQPLILIADSLQHKLRQQQVRSLDKITDEIMYDLFLHFTVAAGGFETPVDSTAEISLEYEA